MIKFQNRIIELTSTDSTNSFAERLLKEKEVREGTIIWAHEQTAGKGQGENVWLSEPGKNLTVTMILYPRFLPVDRQFLLNKAISLGVIDFVHTLLPPESVKIKWPNDICHHYSKLGGILISNIITGNRFNTSVIGIGININQTRFEPTLPNPVSVKQIILQETDPVHALNVLIEMLDKRYDQLKNGGENFLDLEYKNNLLGVNEKRSFKRDKEIFTGIICDVDHYGRLIIETPAKEQIAFSHGEIEFLF